MTNLSDFHIAVMPGDGIGDEIMRPTVALLQSAADRVGGVGLRFDNLEGGAGYFRDHGESMPARTRKIAGDADAILLAAMGLPDVRYPDGREIGPQLELRFDYGLFGGVRPVKPIPGVRPILADARAHDVDYVIVRESTEGLFAPWAEGEVIEDREARETMALTRDTSEKLFDFCFQLARDRAAARGDGSKGKVTTVDKANVFRAFHWQRGIFYERAAQNTDVDADHVYVDAFAMQMVQKPWTFDVTVTENQFGDILSDLGAALMGGLGYAPSADIGSEHAVFQPCHGSAPDIAGKGLANPTAMILSAAMMMEWLGTKENSAEAMATGRLLRSGVEAAFAGGDLVTVELGGDAGTDKVFESVRTAMERLDP
ncbi:MAG: isocitrate/isopropylmalate family dehydrogenase [Pseudomonadota bacterium]